MSLSKSAIKQIKSLKIKKYREIEKQFVAEGRKIVDDLIQSGLKLNKLIVTESFDLTSINVDESRIFVCSEKEMSVLSSFRNAPGILAVFDIPETRREVSDDSYVLALDRINDPGNLGTLIRIADWFGIRDIVLSDETADAYNPKVVQASMGSIARVRLHYLNLKEWLENQVGKRDIYAGVLDGKDIRTVKFQRNGILVIGSESHGLSEELLPFITQGVLIPRLGSAESLNASVAAGIIAAFACL